MKPSREDLLRSEWEEGEREMVLEILKAFWFPPRLPCEDPFSSWW
jgi:hypothetical protein